MPTLTLILPMTLLLLVNSKFLSPSMSFLGIKNSTAYTTMQTKFREQVHQSSHFFSKPTPFWNNVDSHPKIKITKEELEVYNVEATHRYWYLTCKAEWYSRRHFIFLQLFPLINDKHITTCRCHICNVFHELHSTIKKCDIFLRHTTQNVEWANWMCLLSREVWFFSLWRECVGHT